MFHTVYIKCLINFVSYNTQYLDYNIVHRLQIKNNVIVIIKSSRIA